MSKILILFCMLTGTLYSQTFQLGFRSESTWFNLTNKSTEFVPIYHFFVTGGLVEKNIPILHDLTEEIRLGGIITPNYLQGYDLLLALKTHVLTKYLYVSGGLDLHYNIGDAHGATIIYSKNLYLLNFGIGYSPDNIFFIEISKYIPISNNDLFVDYSNYNPSFSLNSLIAISFGINFDLGNESK